MLGAKKQVEKGLGLRLFLPLASMIKNRTPITHIFLKGAVKVEKPSLKKVCRECGGMSLLQVS